MIGADRREYLAVLRATFEELHSEHPGLEYERCVVLHGVSGPVEVSYEDLKFWENQGIQQQPVRGLAQPLDVSAALGSFRLNVDAASFGEVARNVFRSGDTEETWAGRLTRYVDFDQIEVLGIKLKLSEIFKDLLEWDRERRARAGLASKRREG